MLSVQFLEKKGSIIWKYECILQRNKKKIFLQNQLLKIICFFFTLFFYRKI